MVFKPALMRIEPGETVTWMPSDPGHNVESVLGGVPDGTKSFRSKFNQEVNFTFDKEGLYFYKCTPHYGAGMIGVIQVGSNIEGLDQLNELRTPPLVKRRLSEIAKKLQEKELEQSGS